MNKDQINSLVRTLLKVAGSALATHGLTNQAALLNTESIVGAIVAIAGVVWSHYDNKCDPSTGCCPEPEEKKP